MQRQRVAVLAGGTGSVKLVRGFASLENVDLTVISNVADNIWLHGLYVCPDIDTVLYGLAAFLDRVRGWGVKGDTFHCLNLLKKLGSETWFALGDKDLAMHIARTDMIKSGMSLTEATDRIRRSLSVSSMILPASDDPVESVIKTDEGAMHLQEFWVKRHGIPGVRSIEYNGIESSKTTSSVQDAIATAALILISPGNPVTSIGPIIKIPGVSEALSKKKESVIAVSPLVGAEAFSGPAVKYMKAIGVKPSVEGIADYYSDIAGTIAISKKDAKSAAKIERRGIKTVQTEIMMSNKRNEIRLAKTLLRESNAN